MTDPPGPLLGSGRAADVFDIGDGKVLRRYRNVAHDIEHEAHVMAYVGERHYPVPTVHSFDGDDLVMERIDGPTMLEALEDAPWKLVAYARTLARLQHRLARIPAPPWMLAPTADFNHPPSVLHLDLHPMNVIISRRGPVVIDWTNAAGGPAGFDAALTFVEISTFPTTAPRDVIGQRIFARSFRRYRGRQMLDAFLPAACDHRLSDRNLLPDERVAVAALRKKLQRQP
jgi:aminoglycoside phosphotransferase (APT) family kinase protein